jgi:hypothetical protein
MACTIELPEIKEFISILCSTIRGSTRLKIPELNKYITSLRLKNPMQYTDSNQEQLTTNKFNPLSASTLHFKEY